LKLQDVKCRMQSAAWCMQHADSSATCQVRHAVCRCCMRPWCGITQSVNG
jgi:hypothetical protein